MLGSKFIAIVIAIVMAVSTTTAVLVIVIAVTVWPADAAQVTPTSTPTDTPTPDEGDNGDPATPVITHTPDITITTTPDITPTVAITLTPTHDPRPNQELFDQANRYAAEANWDGLIDTLAALRKSDPGFQTARVDGLLFAALRYRGVDKILHANLEGGVYDLAQAERFGPIDIEALNVRQWARLYMFGLSFWEVHPEQAVYYFAQVAAAVLPV